MQPIHQLLSRIRWDAEFAHGRFELGYLDRVQNQIVRVSLNEIRFPEQDSGGFEIVDNAGVAHRVPFHRVREVYKDSEIIWQRPPKEPA